MKITDIECSILIILIILLIYYIYKEYICFINNDSQKIERLKYKYYEKYKYISEIYNEPRLIKIDNIDGLLWSCGNMKKLYILDVKNGLFVSDIHIELFNGYENVEITKEAINKKIVNILQLEDDVKISYNLYNNTAMFKSYDLKLLLIKILHILYICCSKNPKKIELDMKTNEKTMLNKIKYLLEHH